MSKTILIAALIAGTSSLGIAVRPVHEAPVRAAGPLTTLERQRLVAHLQMTESWLNDEVSGLGRAQLEFRTSPEAWSIMQVVDHLLVVAPIYWQDLQTALKKPRSTGSRMTDADILWYGIDRTVREKAIPTEVPKGQWQDPRAALDEFRKHHLRLKDFINTTDSDLRNHIVERQGSDAYQWALLISTHEQRHILQIRQVKADPKFPR